MERSKHIAGKYKCLTHGFGTSNLDKMYKHFDETKHEECLYVVRSKKPVRPEVIVAVKP